MTILQFDLEKLPIASVQAATQQLTESLQAEMPLLSLRQGVIHDYVIYPAAILQTAFQEAILQLQAAGDIDTLHQAPVEVVDRVARNFLVTRLPGETATGNITLVLDSPALTVIPAGATFVAQGKIFRTDFAFLATDNPSLVRTSTDRLLTPIGDGFYAFSIPVRAEEVGEASRLRKDTPLVSTLPIPHLVRIYATDFTGGYSAEETEMLVARLKQGPAAKMINSVVGMRAWLNSQPQFSRIVASSVVGAGDPEMQRDRHTIFPGATGGRIDWYIKPAALPQIVDLVKTATFVRVDEQGRGIWQIDLLREDAPAFYRIKTIRPKDSGEYSGSFEIVFLQFGKDLSPLENVNVVPDIVNDQEARFTCFQTATVQFVDTLTPTPSLIAGETTKEYVVTVATPLLIAELQEQVLEDAARIPATDCLIKAAIPCRLQFSCYLNLSPSQQEPANSTLVEAATSFANAAGFPGCFSVGALVASILRQVTPPGYIDSAVLLAEIDLPDNTTHRWVATDTLVIPEWPHLGISKKTVTFYLEPEDVTINVRRVASLIS